MPPSRRRGLAAISHERQPNDEPILNGPLRRASGRDPESFPEVVEADPGRSRRLWSRPEIVLEHQRRVFDPHTDLEMKVRPDGVVLQRVLKKLGE